jgi:hypothetical protein
MRRSCGEVSLKVACEFTLLSAMLIQWYCIGRPNSCWLRNTLLFLTSECRLWSRVAVVRTQADAHCAAIKQPFAAIRTTAIAFLQAYVEILRSRQNRNIRQAVC